MNAIAKSWAGGRGGAPGAGKKNQKVVLIALSVVLLGVLAFELPHLLKGSSSPSATATLSVTTTATTPIGATPIGATPTGTDTAAPSTAAVGSSATERSIKKLRARDPFAPLAGDVAPTASAPPATVTSPPATPTTATPTTTATAATPVTTTAASTATPTASTPPSASTGTPPMPVAVPEIVPTQAVIFTNSRRLVIDLQQVFKVGDTSFKLLAVNARNVKIAIIGGVFTGGKPTMLISRSKPLTLVNNATGVRYPLRFSRAASGLTATVQALSPATPAVAVPTPAAPAAVVAVPVTTTASTTTGN